MESLIELLSTLNKGERNLLQKNLESNAQLKRSKLIGALLSHVDMSTHISYDELGLSEASRYQLAHSTKEWLFGFILQQDEKSKVKSPLSRKRILTFKYLIFSHTSNTRGIRKDSIGYLKKAIKIARQYEFVDLEIVALNQLFARFMFMDRHQELKLFQNRIKELHKMSAYLNEVQWIRYEVAKNQSDISNWKTVERRLFKSRLERINQIADETGLATVRAFYYRFAYRYYSATRDVKRTLKTAQDFLALAASKPALKSLSNQAGGNLQIATALNRLADFEKATIHARLALKLFGKTNSNSEIASHVLFTALFHSQNFVEAKTLTTKYKRNKWIKQYPFRRGKWLFFEAALHYRNGEYVKSMSALRNCGDLLKDKTGWQYGYRLLEIYIQYENYRAEIPDNYILNFRRFIRGHDVQVKSRVSLIIKVLRALERSRFNFTKVAKSNSKMLRTLEEGKGLYFYEPSGFEMIRFDLWFKEKLKQYKRK